jgi:hypothetical protein
MLPHRSVADGDEAPATPARRQAQLITTPFTIAPPQDLAAAKNRTQATAWVIAQLRQTSFNEVMVS